MPFDLSGKVAIVTGAGQGIGEKIAEVFAQAGAKVVVATRTVANGQETVDNIRQKGGDALLLQTDIGKKSAVIELVGMTVDHYGGLDIVVHNAGVYPIYDIQELPEEALEQTLSVNLKAAFWLCQESLPHLKSGGGGRLIFTSSVTGPKGATPGLAHYAASKAGLNGFIRSAAMEFAKENITVNGVEPGLILTPAMAALGDEEDIKQMAHYIPKGHLGRPEDIAYTMLFLASEEAGYITGETITVDGASSLVENGFFM